MTCWIGEREEPRAMNDMILFAVFPYVAIVVAIVGGVYRYRTNRFSYSSLSSQLLENRKLFWGSVPWHYGIIVVLLAHLVGFLVPGMWASITSAPAALYTIELVGFAFGLAALVGMCVLIVRRYTTERILAVTSPMDGVLLAALLVQVVLGIWVSLVYRWGADWYVDTAVPWLISLVSLNPQTQYVSTLPSVVKLHMLTGFVVIALFPFSRLVHLIMFPFWYLWRPYQLVISNRSVSRSGKAHNDSEWAS
jgi:nitrate reductase gamma subunit